ncbi:hypothetical protein BJ166DRAFT_323073 [Pestalotiopsis sp. NC0098]|nr:hypothetical protein BJ166DRAFT_323073 [Pestalotiopsis sp. NC0098]
MGFLGFLSRKPALAPNGQPDLLQAQPYNATVASLPPIRGTVPVAGNGPNNLETLQQRTRPRVKGLQDHPSSVSVAAASSAPDDKVDRPRTAPSQDRTWSASRRTGSMKTTPVPALPPVLPPLPLLSSKPRPPFRLPDSEPSPTFSSFKSRSTWKLLEKTDKSPKTPDLDKPLPPFARPRSSSTNSNQSGLNGHLDLLDAQAGINPTNFRQRVQANGARDYGEDVADRNLVESATNMHIAGSRTSFRPASVGSRPTSYIPSVHEEPEPESPTDAKLLKRHSLGSSLRTRSMASDIAVTRHSSNRKSVHADSRPRSRVRIDENGGEGLVASIRAEWRKSLPSYIAATGPRELDEFPEALRVKNDGTPGSADFKERSRSRPALIQRSSTSDGQGRGKLADSDGISSREHATRISNDPSTDSTSKGPSDGQRKLSIVTSGREADQKASKRLSLQNLQALTKRRDDFDNEATRTQPRNTAAEPRTHRKRASTTGSQDFPAECTFQAFAPEKPAPKPSPKPSRAVRDLLTVKKTTKSKSPEPSYSRALARVDSEDVPERSSSLRRWSMDSTSATSLSSNPFRPQSRHTANTSIDLSPFAAKDLNFSHDSLSYPAAPEILFPPSPGNARPPSPPPRSARRLQKQTSTNFNIYDYISDDDDDEHAPRQRRGEGEEHLLFKDDGFAMSGFGLPGLSGAIDTGAPLYVPSSPPRMNYKPSKASKTRDYDDFLLQKYKHLMAEHKQATATRSRRSRHRAPARYYEDSDSSEEEQWGPVDDSSDDEMSFDIPMTRRSNQSLQQQYRPTRYTSREQVIVEEEREIPQVELPTALRSRAEDRRWKRLSGMSGMSGASGSTIRLRSDSGKGKGKEVPRLRRYDVAGFDADLD